MVILRKYPLSWTNKFIKSYQRQNFSHIFGGTSLIIGGNFSLITGRTSHILVLNWLINSHHLHCPPYRMWSQILDMYIVTNRGYCTIWDMHHTKLQLKTQLTLYTFILYFEYSEHKIFFHATVYNCSFNLYKFPLSLLFTSQAQNTWRGHWGFAMLHLNTQIAPEPSGSKQSESPVTATSIQ